MYIYVSLSLYPQYIYLSIYQSIFLSFYLPIYLSIHPTVYQSISIAVSAGEEGGEEGEPRDGLLQGAQGDLRTNQLCRQTD